MTDEQKAPSWGDDWACRDQRTADCALDKTHPKYTTWCMQHRDPRNQPFWTNCPKCNAQWEVEEQAKQNGQTERQRLHAAKIVAANIPERFKGCTVWNWQHGIDQQRRVWDWVREYVSSFEHALGTGRSVIFLGATGTGKTHLAVGVAQHVMEKGGTAYYTTVIDMLGRIKATYGSNAPETEAFVVKHLQSVDVLVIDEVGRALDTSYEVAQFFRLLSRRHAACRPTVLVTNLNRALFEKFMGPEAMDRMMENGGSVLVFDWASQRSRRKPKGEDE